MTKFSRLILVDPEAALCDAWRECFEGLARVEIVHGRFESLTGYDCMVSAANSFGLMDGGVDLAIIQYFGLELMDAVQDWILKDFRGEQPVGTSFIIETGHARHPYLAHTPTMRVPMPITRTDNVYQAMWAMLLAVDRHNAAGSGSHIDTVACPGARHRDRSLALRGSGAADVLRLPAFPVAAQGDHLALCRGPPGCCGLGRGAGPVAPQSPRFDSEARRSTFMSMRRPASSCRLNGRLLIAVKAGRCNSD